MNSNHSISKIIRWYKGKCTYEIRKKYNPDFKWQSRFYDHIIRNEKSYQKIKEYIRYNPNQWEDDRYYESRLYP
jgi:putative transposase